MIVVWRINERCNLACPFCAYDKTVDRARRSTDAKEVERFAGLLAEYGRIQSESVLISWIGGEPLLWAPLFDLGQRLRRHREIRLSATTNGTTLHRSSVQQGILDGFDELTVSIDGPQHIHDSLRRAPGNWNRIARGVAELARRRQAGTTTLKTLRANVVLMRNNLPYFADCCRQLAELGIDEITFNALGGRDRPEYFLAHRLRPNDIAQLESLLPPLRAELAHQGARLCGGATYLNRLRDGSNDRPVLASDCRPGSNFLFIDEAGRVAPCHFTADELGIPSASILSVEAIAALTKVFERQSRTRRPVACGECPSTHVFAKFAA